MAPASNKQARSLNPLLISSDLCFPPKNNPRNLFPLSTTKTKDIEAMASSASSAAPPPDDLDWEEWDAASSPLSFGHHCLAGSFAGVAEHTLLYPLDTVKTCWQSQVLGGCGGEASCGVGAVVSSVRGAGGSGGALGASQAMAGVS